MQLNESIFSITSNLINPLDLAHPGFNNFYLFSAMRLHFKGEVNWREPRPALVDKVTRGEMQKRIRDNPYLNQEITQIEQEKRIDRTEFFILVEDYLVSSELWYCAKGKYDTWKIQHPLATVAEVNKACEDMQGERQKQKRMSWEKLEK